MASSTSDRVLLPRRGPKTQMVFWVMVSSVGTALLMAGTALHASHRQIQESLETTHPKVHEWTAQKLQRRIQQAQAEFARIAGDRSLGDRLGGAARASAGSASDPVLEGVLGEALTSSRSFSGLLVLGAEGAVRAAVGSGPELDKLLEVLAPKDSIGSELLDVMQTAETRRRLRSVEELSLHVFEAADMRPCPMASVSLRAANGRRVGSIHGLLRREVLSESLHSDLLQGETLYLTVGDGILVAAGGDGAAETPEALPSGLAHVGAVPRVQPVWSRGAIWAVASSQPAGVFGWHLVVQQPVLSAFQPVVSASLRLAACGGAAVLFFTIVASWRARAASRSVLALFTGLRRAARGELETELPEPKSDDQFAAVIRAFNLTMKRMRDLRERDEAHRRALEGQNLAFQDQHDVLSKLSVTDGLTELHNHRYFQDQLRREVKRISRTHEGLSMLMIDIDDFKQLNDSIGHAAGDECLRLLAKTFKESVRETDLLARYGGEEFVVLTPNTDAPGAAILAEKLRTKVAETSFILDSSMRPRRVTVSIGVAQYAQSRAELFSAADAALYRAKASGKNCVITAGSDEADA